jgi:O-antigen/teichoic acid export membrane protein
VHNGTITEVISPIYSAIHQRAQLSLDRNPIDAFSVDHLRADLKSRSVRGGVLTLTSQGVQFILQSISTIVLARLLKPADFGLVAMVTAITGFGQAFADLGLSEATIQRPEISHKQVSTLFWINVAVGLTLASITASLAPLLAWFYREPRLQTITLVVSTTFIVGGLRVQHDALLRRQMRFVSLTIRDIAAYIIAVSLAILLAVKGAGYWAIVGLPLLLNFCIMALSWVMAGWIPGLPHRDAKVKSLIAFGGNVAGSYLVWNIYQNADNVLIGWHWGAGPLGLYSRAYNLLMLPIRQLGGPSRSVAVPAFSRVQSEPELLARYYLRVANIIMWITAPLFGFLFVSAAPVVMLVLGRQWVEAAPVFQILAIFALGQLLLESTVWLFVSRGQSRRLFRLSLTICPIIVAAYAIGLPFGIREVALSGSLAFLSIFPWVLRYSFKGTAITLRRLGRVIVYPIAVSLCGAFAAEMLLRATNPHQALGQLVMTCAGFAAGCLLSLFVTPIREDLLALKGILSKAGFGIGPDLAETAS